MRSNNDALSWRTLPGKEQSVFKHMMWLYEQKHNKKAVKQADIILKKFPEHGETLSMKGLILSNMGSDKKQEAYDYAKRGLRADITNCVCWHVLGLLYRQDKDYAEASKCFVQTLRLDPNNYQAMKDLANLQIHERNLQGFLETRRHILKARSRFIREWAAFAMANHLVGRLTVAQDILSEMENQFGESQDLDAFEKSEIMLYKATLLEEMGEYRKCYGYISEQENNILDENALLEMQGRMAIFLQQHDIGRAAYKRLVESNKDNECYVLGLMACDEDERIRKLFALPCCSFNGSFGRADSMDFLKNLKQLNDGKIFRSNGDPYIYLMPGSLRSSGEDSGGWLESCFTKQADREARVQDSELELVSGWKPCRRTRAPPSFRMVRIPSPETQNLISRYFDNFCSVYSPCPLVDYLRLYFLTGDRFVAALDDFLRPQLRRGVVSLFSALRRLYTRNRVGLIESVLESYVLNLEKSPSTFGPRLGRRSEKREDEEVAEQEQNEIATCLLYAYMLLAQHYDFTQQVEKALYTIQKAIDHTPTFADLYVVKGRIYKHAGAYQQACEFHEKARNLDLADRFLNSKACSYMLRVNRTDEAKSVASLFTRQCESKDVPDTQCMWFEIKMGRARVRRKEYLDALGDFHATIRHFEEIHEDQFDFHPYCLRKSTFRAYVAFLRMQDKVWSHSYFRQAAHQALRIYMALHDGSIALSSDQKDENGKKPEAAKAKKKSASAKQQQKQKAAEKEQQPVKYPKDEPLVAAEKILNRLLSCCVTDEQTHFAHYNFALRKGATMAMVLALVRLSKLTRREGLNSLLTPLLFHFSKKGNISNIPEEMRDIAASALSSAYGRAVSPTEESLRAAGDSLMKELMGKCIENPRDFVLRRRAFEAFQLAGEPVPFDSPLLNFERLPPPSSESAESTKQQREEEPSLVDCEELLAELQRSSNMQNACEQLKSCCRDAFPLSDLLQC